MPKITPVPERSWICGGPPQKYLKAMYGNQRLRLTYLPRADVVPEDFLKVRVLDVEIIIACLQGGAWLEAEDWKPYARMAISKRLHARADVLFVNQFLGIRDTLLEYQLNGGEFKTQATLRGFCAEFLRRRDSRPFDRVMCQLILSIIGDSQTNAVIQPFHWIRVAVGWTDYNPVFGMTLFHSEMAQQKVTLCQCLRASLP